MLVSACIWIQSNTTYVSLASRKIITILIKLSSCIQIGMRVNMFILTAAYTWQGWQAVPENSDTEQFFFPCQHWKYQVYFGKISKGDITSKYETLPPFQLAGLSSGISVTACVSASIHGSTALWSAWVSHSLVSLSVKFAKVSLEVGHGSTVVKSVYRKVCVFCSLHPNKHCM